MAQPSATSQLEAARAAARPGKRYVTVQVKFVLTLAIASAWAVLSFWIAQRWITELAGLIGAPLAIMIIMGIAILPGFMNAFLVAGLLLDRRPRRKPITIYPDVTILVAAYNEEDSILSTLKSIELQHYPAQLDVIVINDGSTDGTMKQLASVSYPWLRVIDLPKNAGKANALNVGLKQVSFALTITLDADSYLYANALTNLVGRYLGDPDNTAAVAGAVLVRNSRLNLVTKIQEWDYFHGIAAIKRLQSLFQGTLVAQGASPSIAPMCCTRSAAGASAWVKTSFSPGRFSNTAIVWDIARTRARSPTRLTRSDNSYASASAGREG